MSNPQEIDLENLQQEDALYPWLANGSMEDETERPGLFEDQVEFEPEPEGEEDEPTHLEEE
jgi:hypothetical protein